MVDDDDRDETEVPMYGWVRLGVCRLRSMIAEAHEGDTCAMNTPGIEIMGRFHAAAIGCSQFKVITVKGFGESLTKGPRQINHIYVLENFHF